MEIRLPDIPVKPKLFQHKIEYKKAALYEHSSIEFSQEQPIYVDYDMGMTLDLIARDQYMFTPKTNIRPDMATLQASLEEMRLSLLDERDRYILQDGNSIKTQVIKKEKKAD
jgi:Paf1